MRHIDPCANGKKKAKADLLIYKEVILRRLEFEASLNQSKGQCNFSMMNTLSASRIKIVSVDQPEKLPKFPFLRVNCPSKNGIFGNATRKKERKAQ